MKTRPVSLPAILLAIATAGSLTSFAQPSPAAKSEGREAPRPGPAFQERLAAIVRPGDFAVIRVLTEEQRNSFREALAEQRDKARELEKKLRDAREAAIAAGLTKTFDENNVREKALEVGRLEAELAVIRARALSEVKPPLSTEQIEQIKNPPPFKPGQDRLRPVRRGVRPNAGPRDENDLPAKPKPEK